MAAVAGILGQEILGVQPVWFEAGTKEYIFPITTLTALEFLILGPLELKRYRGWKEHKTVRPCTLELIQTVAHFVWKLATGFGR